MKKIIITKSLTKCFFLYSSTLIMIVLLIVAYICIVYSSCPPSCRCRGIYVSCTSLTTTELPNDIPLNTEILTLQFSSVKSIPSRYFSKFINLKELNIHGLLNFSINESTFLGSQKLQKINVSGNEVEHVSLGSFKNLTLLNILDLSNNKLSVIQKDVFIGLSRLSNIYLKSNMITHIESNGFQHLSSLRKLDLSKNILKRIRADIFNGSALTLTDINLASNKINNVERKAFLTMSSVRKLNLNNNHLSIVSRNMFFGLSKLYTLNLQGNWIHQIQNKSFKHCISLKYLDLSFNKLSIIHKEMFYDLSKVYKFQLYSNNINKIYQGSFNYMPALNILDLGFNKLTVIDPDIFNGLSNVLILALDHNTIRSIRLTKGLENLQVLHLQYNNLDSIHNNSFPYMPYLKRLSLAHNRLLNINNLAEYKLERLEYLWLYSNRLSYFSMKEFSSFVKLRTLNLGDNNITIFHAGDMHITHKQLNAVNLRNNPLICTCKFIKSITVIRRATYKTIIKAICHKPIRLENVDTYNLKVTNLCRNYATGIMCTPLNSIGYSCICKRNYSGKYCQFVSPTCSPQICNNQGQCIEKDNTKICICNQGYTGKYCKYRKSSCNGNSTGYQCGCKGRYNGRYCENVTLHCNYNPCRNNGICSETMDNFFCRCNAKYTGRICDIHILSNSGRNSTKCLAYTLIIVFVVINIRYIAEVSHLFFQFM